MITLRVPRLEGGNMCCVAVIQSGDTECVNTEPLLKQQLTPQGHAVRCLVPIRHDSAGDDGDSGGGGGGDNALVMNRVPDLSLCLSRSRRL